MRRNEGTPSSEPSITLKEPLGSEVRYLGVREKEREREREREKSQTQRWEELLVVIRPT